MVSGKRLLILTEAGEGIGFGHYTRCNAIREYSISVGIATDMLLAVNGNENQFPGSNLVNWREQDVNVEPYSHILIDSYLATNDRIARLAASGKRLIAIDDYRRIDRGVDLVINPNLYGHKMKYAVPFAGGPRYVILRKAFREETRKVKIAGKVTNILVTLGGSDIHSLLPKLVMESKAVFNEAFLHVVAASERYKNELFDQWGPDKNVELYGFVGEQEMKALMLNSDLAISSCGQTLHELAWLGLPAEAVCVGEDQVKNMKEYVRRGFLGEEMYWDQPALNVTLRRSLEDLSAPELRLRRSENGRSIFNGDGLRNIAEVMFGDGLVWRYANESDTRQYFDWANDPDVRANAHLTSVIQWENHLEWFTKKISSDNTLMLVFYLGTTAVGQVRVEWENSQGLIDFSVDKRFRGKSLGKKMIAATAALVEDLYSDRVLVAEVKDTNVASAKTFETTGFKLMATRDVNGVNCKVFQLGKENV
jgi:UDP-2,4-diacetamido-2,4,6-trideoxy-beta-L-altropyranose hydrolase